MPPAARRSSNQLDRHRQATYQREIAQTTDAAFPPLVPQCVDTPQQTHYTEYCFVSTNRAPALEPSERANALVVFIYFKS